MNLTAAIFMGLSCACVLALTGFCFWTIFRVDRKGNDTRRRSRQK